MRGGFTPKSGRGSRLPSRQLGAFSAARTRSKNSEDRPEGRHRPADWGV